MRFKLVRGNLGCIATLNIQGEVTRDECERLFREHCDAKELKIDGPIYTLVQQGLDGYGREEAESAAYVLSATE